MKCPSKCTGGSVGLARGYRIIECETCWGKGYVCPDGGTCHHDCEDGRCFRVRSCASFEPDGSWARFELCPSGHPADGSPCVSYKCERLASSSP